jgi:hypothetical protein
MLSVYCFKIVVHDMMYYKGRLIFIHIVVNLPFQTPARYETNVL